MRVKDLLRLLKTYDDDTEVRIAACMEDPNYGGNSHDLPIAGLSNDFAPPNSLSLKTLTGQSVLWIVTSYLLAPQATAPRKKSGKRIYQASP